MESPAGFNYMGHRSGDGTEYDVVEPKSRAANDADVYYFISRTDNLIRRTVENANPGTQPTTWTLLKNVRKNVPIDRAKFRWTLPTSATQVQMPAGVQLPVHP
jgi:outer membrane lipoprotein-sorting protein